MTLFTMTRKLDPTKAHTHTIHRYETSRSLSVFNEILSSMIFTAYEPRLCFDMVSKLYRWVTSTCKAAFSIVIFTTIAHLTTQHRHDVRLSTNQQ